VVTCDDRKILEEFEKANRNDLAMDGEGNLAFLAEGNWTTAPRGGEVAPDRLFTPRGNCDDPVSAGFGPDRVCVAKLKTKERAGALTSA
jgi:hypothetical protein